MTRSRRHRLPLIGLFVAAAIALTTSVSRPRAQEPPPGPVATAAYEALGRDGEVVVVVSLRRPAREIEARGRRERIATRQQRILDGLGGNGYRVRHRFQAIAGLALVVESRDVLDRLQTLPGIRRVDVDAGGRAGLAESVPLVGGDVAQAAGFKGKGVKVAVLDTGIDTNHRDLRKALVDEACVCNTGSNCCPTGGSSAEGKGSAEDDNGHGTHVAGIVASRGRRSSVGVAPKADIVAVKVIAASNGFCCSSDIAAGLDWVLENHPDTAAVNMSLGTFAEFSGNCDNSTSWTQVLADAVNALHRNGTSVLVASMNAGNTNGMAAPACLKNAISVGATNKSDEVASFSNSGKRLDLLAPGVSILASGMGGGTATLSGTSMATPHVAGAAALWAEHQGSRLPAGERAKKFKRCAKKSKVKIKDTRNGLTRRRLDVPQLLECGGADLS